MAARVVVAGLGAMTLGGGDDEELRITVSTTCAAELICVDQDDLIDMSGIGGLVVIKIPPDVLVTTPESLWAVAHSSM